MLPWISSQTSPRLLLRRAMDATAAGSNRIDVQLNNLSVREELTQHGLAVGIGA